MYNFSEALYLFCTSSRDQVASRQAEGNRFSAGLPEEPGHLQGAAVERGTGEPGRVRGCGVLTSSC